MHGKNHRRGPRWRPGVPFLLVLCVLIVSALAGGAALALSGASGTSRGPGLPASGSARTSASRCRTHLVQARANALTAAAKRRYGHEEFGVAVHAALKRVAQDRRLLRALSVGALRAARVEARRQLIQHTVRIRIMRGSRVLVDANPSSFAVAGPTAKLHGNHGRALGEVEVTIQDVVGFIKLVHKYHPAHVVVRGKHGHVKTSLPAARARRLPASGCVTIAGRAYAVRSFSRIGFAGERLRVWVLV